MVPQLFSYLFQDTAFFIQGQMDIHPKSRWYKPDFKKMTGGFGIINDTHKRKICNLEPWDVTRRDMLILLLRTIIENDIEGSFAELGVYKGLTAKLIHYYAPERNLFLFDTFKGFTAQGIESEKKQTGLIIPGNYFSDTNLVKVKRFIAPLNSNICFQQGYFPDSIPALLFNKKFSFVHLDADLYEPTFKGLHFFYERMTVDGIIVIHDYNSWSGARKATDEFFYDKIEIPIPMPDKCGSAIIVKR